MDTPFLFHGRTGVMSDGNGLYHMRNRYYHPELRRFLNPDPRGQGRARERRPGIDLLGQAQRLAHPANPGLAQLQDRLQHLVPEHFLGIDAELFEDVVLALHARDRLLDVGPVGALEQELRAA